MTHSGAAGLALLSPPPQVTPVAFSPLTTAVLRSDASRDSRLALHGALLWQQNTVGALEIKGGDLRAGGRNDCVTRRVIELDQTLLAPRPPRPSGVRKKALAAGLHSFSSSVARPHHLTLSLLFSAHRIPEGNVFRPSRLPRMHFVRMSTADCRCIAHPPPPLPFPFLSFPITLMSDASRTQ